MDDLSESSYDMLESPRDTLDSLQAIWSDIDSADANRHMIMAYQYKLELLMQIIKTKNNEIQLLERDLTIMKLRASINLDKKNATIKELQDRLAQVEGDSSEWI
jgi:hypothetical protein